MLALAPSDGPLYRGRLLRALAAFAVPAGLAIAAASLASFFLVDTVFGGSLEAGRTAATTTLVVLGLCFILLLERGPGREHIAIQSYMLALVAALGALYALILAVQPVRDFFDLTRMGGGQLFLALLSAAAGLVLASVVWRIPVIEQLEDKPAATRRGADRARHRASHRAARPPHPALGTLLMPSSGPVGLRLTAHPRTPPAAPRSSPPSGRRAAPRRCCASSSMPASTSSGSTSPTGPPRSRPRTSAGSARSARRSAARSGSSGTFPGPKLRLGDLEGDVAVLHSGSNVVLRGRDQRDAAETPSSSRSSGTASPRRCTRATPSSSPTAGSGSRSSPIEGGHVTCEIEAGGAVSSHQGVNLPGADADLPETGASDQPWIDFACDNGIDLLAVSFVRRPSDLEKVEARLRERGADIPLIAKIEKPQAAERAEEIIEAAGSGIMVARGDLGVELPIEEVPGAQKRLIALAGRASKPAITATQMLATMVRASRPTRAEVTDVANAIYDGTDAVMLSEETAIGDYPVEAVRVMDRIARVTEPRLHYGELVFTRVEEHEHDIAETVAQVAVAACYRLGLKAIVCPTSSGRTARLISAHRPRVPVLAVSPAAGDRPPDEPALRHQLGAGRGLDLDPQAARRLRDARPRSGDRRVRRPGRDHRRATGAGHRHQPL